MPENIRSAAIVGDPDLSSQQGPASQTGATGANSGGSHAKQILNRVTEGAHHAVDRFAEKAGPAVEKIESGVSHANESLAEQAQHMRELGDEWTQGLRKTVRANPLTSVLLAMVAGAVIARVTR
ncbi:putative RNA-binding Zn ribbon-like protein [Hydrogenophaga palleronii]|uniref:RNA-binding Zn ribbon-like protein n=1 Tax=Hydrogenophaga palleronii TaxID=65655 RepID=A0ABU1WN37_9BURK|nr:hypothetical protein [Hydrogenophaga palleronii]MDR7150653.1 putative RNA-binding Zn ribbon-like protein [Hydrogenophaga palleronii]